MNEAIIVARGELEAAQAAGQKFVIVATNIGTDGKMMKSLMQVKIRFESKNSISTPLVGVLKS